MGFKPISDYFLGWSAHYFFFPPPHTNYALAITCMNKKGVYRVYQKGQFTMVVFV